MKYKKHLKAIETLNNIYDERSKYFIIHYACESFYKDPMAKTPRITAIAVRSLDSGQTYSFSMHGTAEILGIEPSDITKQYDDIEFHMLKDFADFLQKHMDKNWVHWNMRDGNYGFQAIEHRYRILQNKFKSNRKANVQMPIINDSNKYNLSDLFIDKYGAGYAPNPRIPSLMSLNKLNPKGFLSGADEAAAFENGNFHMLLMSTLSKVKLFSIFLEKAIDNDLKTQSKKSDVYDGWGAKIIDFAQNNPCGVIGIPIITTILGYLLGKFC